MAKLRGTEFVSEEKVQDAFDALHEIATDLNANARDRIDAARELVNYGGVQFPYPPWVDADGVEQGPEEG